MNLHKHPLSDTWAENFDVFSNKVINTKYKSIGKYLSDIFALGPFYYYIIKFEDHSLFNQSESMLELHGLVNYPQYIFEVLDLIHPDDIDFVIQAESEALKQLKIMGLHLLPQVKSSYCFRMRVADGQYHVFHHQAINLGIDKENRITISLNIHTDINHITTQNSHILSLQGIAGLDKNMQINLKNNCGNLDYIPTLSRREKEILPFIAQGYCSRVIAEKLFIAEETVRIHRKNLLKKTKANCSSVMIKNCIEWGLL